MDQLGNDPHLCLDALLTNASRPEQGDGAEWEKVPKLSGKDIAIQFSQQAAEELSPEHFAQLTKFLRHPRPSTPNAEQLEKRVETALQNFYSQETTLSHQDEEKLAKPGGVLHSDLCMVLHLETKDDDFGNIFNEDNATIKLLQSKGTNPDTVCAIDWHWRGETEDDFSQRRTCQFYKFGKDVRDLHNSFSWQFLGMIPARIIVVSSSCARDGIRRRIPSAVRLKVDCLDFDLDFRSDGRLHRIFLYLPHPTAGFFAGELTRDTMADQLDAGWNFVLWFTGKPHSLNTFRNEYNPSNPNRLVRYHPWIEVHRYRQMEKDEQRILKLEEYAPSFLRFAQNYLQNRSDSAVDLAEGSLVSRLQEHFSSSMSAAAVKRNQRDLEHRQECDRQQKEELERQRRLQKEREHQRQEESEHEQQLGNEHESRLQSEFVLDSIQGSRASVSSRGTVMIKRKRPLRNLKIRITEMQAHKILELKKGMPLVRLTLESLQLLVEGEVVYERALRKVPCPPNSDDWTLQLSHETQLLGQPLFLEATNPKKSTTPSFLKAAFVGQQRPLQRHRCEILGIELRYPDAVTNAVFLRAEIVTVGNEHPHRLCVGTPKGDPGRRLAIKSTHTTARGIVERWEKLTGSRNIMKANALTDLLEGRHRQWIAKQPRRYLVNHERRRHWYST